MEKKNELHIISKKEKLEIEKIEAEISNLKKPFWKKPSIFLPIIIPIIAIGVAYYVNKDYINLKLEIKKLQLEKESFKLEEEKENLAIEINTKRQLLIEYSNANDSLKSLINESDKDLSNLQKQNSDLSANVGSLSLEVRKKESELSIIKLKSDSLLNLSNHRLHYIAMEDQLDLLRYLIGYGKGMFYAYRRALEFNQWDWYYGRQQYKVEIDEFYNEFEPYPYNDTLAIVEKKMKKTWETTKLLLYEIDSLVIDSADIDIPKYVKLLNETESKYNPIVIPRDCWINYDNLQLDCNNK